MLKTRSWESIGVLATSRQQGRPHQELCIDTEVPCAQTFKDAGFAANNAAQISVGLGIFKLLMTGGLSWWNDLCAWLMVLHEVT